MLSLLVREYRAFYPKKKFMLLRAVKCYYCVPQFRVVVLIRRMQETHSFLLKRRLQKKLKLNYMVDIGIHTVIGRHFWTEHFTGMVIGDGVRIGDNCTIYQNVTIGQRHGSYPSIGNHVTIYPNAVVLGKIHIGDGAVILAGSVVLHDVCQNGIVGGNPAVLKKVAKI